MKRKKRKKTDAHTCSRASSSHALRISNRPVPKGSPTTLITPLAFFLHKTPPLPHRFPDPPSFLSISPALSLSQLDSQTASRRPPQPPRSRGASATAPAAPRDGLTASAAPGAPPLRGAGGQNLARRISLTLPDFEPFRATGRRRSRAAEARRDVRIRAWK